MLSAVHLNFFNSKADEINCHVIHSSDYTKIKHRRLTIESDEVKCVISIGNGRPSSRLVVYLENTLLLNDQFLSKDGCFHTISIASKVAIKYVCMGRKKVHTCHAAFLQFFVCLLF